MKKLPKNTKKSSRLLFWLIATVSVLTVIHLVLQYININILNEEYGGFYELTNRFDFDDEASIPTWVSQFIFLLISGLAGLIAFMEREKAKKSLWFFMAIIALLGSLDEVATLHENILQNLHVLFFDESSPTILANAWILIVPFVLIAGLLFVLKAIAILPKKTLKLLVIALGLYLTGSVFMDIVISSNTTLGGFMSEGILVAAEEVLEMTGLVVTLYALADYAETKFGKRIKKAKIALGK